MGPRAPADGRKEKREKRKEKKTEKRRREKPPPAEIIAVVGVMTDATTIDAVTDLSRAMVTGVATCMATAAEANSR